MQEELSQCRTMARVARYKTFGMEGEKGSNMNGVEKEEETISFKKLCLLFSVLCIGNE